MPKIWFCGITHNWRHEWSWRIKCTLHSNRYHNSLCWNQHWNSIILQSGRTIHQGNIKISRRTHEISSHSICFSNCHNVHLTRWNHESQFRARIINNLVFFSNIIEFLIFINHQNSELLIKCSIHMKKEINHSLMMQLWNLVSLQSIHQT
jgi:hypothetical protein